MTLLSLILCIIYIDTDADKLTFYSVSAMTSPLMILFISSLAKCILLKTKKLALWCSLCSFGLAQTILLILKLDFSFDIDWKVIVSPLAFMFLPLLICSVHSALNRYQAGDRIGIFFSAIVMIGCLGGIVLIIILQELIVYGKNEFIEFEFWGWITISFLGVGYSRKCGGWVLSIIFGHLEVDYWNFRNPVKVTDASMRSKTV